MVDVSVDKFSVFVPLEIIEKSGKDGKPEMVIKGVASTRKQDSDDEILEPDGFDVSKFLKSGFLNYNHLASKDPSMIIGEPTKAIAKNGELYIEGILYNESEMACKVYDTAKVLKKGSKTRAFGFSIEGKALERDPLNPKRITKASITGCAITPSPKNPGTSLEIVKGGIDAMDFSLEEGEEFLIDVTDENGVRTTVDTNFVIEKSEPDTELELYEPEDISKAGEGSRGGKVIGRTKSGKPIYEHTTADHDSYKNFSKQDHKDAADAHYKHYHKDGADGSIVLHGKRALESHIKHFQKAELEEYDIEKGGEGSRAWLKKSEESEFEKAMEAGETTGTDTHDQSLTQEPLKKESLNGAKKKKKKTEQDKKTFSKSETYDEIFSMFNCNVEDAQHLYKLIEEIQYVLTPNMEKVQITPDAIKKAQELLGLATTSAPDAEAAKKADDLKKAEEAKKIEVQSQIDDLLKKAEDLKSQLTGAAAPATTEPAKAKIEVAAEDKISKAFDEKFNAIGLLIESKDEQLNLIKNENAELKKGISEITEFNKLLASRLNLVAQQPMDRKSVTTTSFIEKGGDNGSSNANSGLKTLSLSNRSHRAELADVLFKAATANPERLDEDLAKAVKSVELGYLGDTPQFGMRILNRLQTDFKINVVK